MAICESDVIPEGRPQRGRALVVLAAIGHGSVVAAVAWQAGRSLARWLLG